MRTRLYADPAGRFLHEAILDSCSRFGNKTALVDTSTLDASGSAKLISYAELGEMIVAAAHGLVAAGMKPGERAGIFLPNSWEFCVASHAITLAGGIPSPLNPSYRDREVRRFQLRDCGAAFLISNGPLISGIEFSDLSQLRRIYTTRQHAGGIDSVCGAARQEFRSDSGASRIFGRSTRCASLFQRDHGIPKDQRHSNLLTNVYQFLAPGEAATFNRMT